MRFTDVFIKRPVLAVSISFLIVLLGLQAIFKMQVREYPEMTNTVITVSIKLLRCQCRFDSRFYYSTLGTSGSTGG